MSNPVTYQEALKAMRAERKRVDKERGRPRESMSAADRERLGALLVEYLSQVGEAREVPYSWGVEFILDTHAGELVVCYEPHHGTIFAKFSDPKPGMPWGANPHSGKWNFHHDPSNDADSAFSEFRNELQQVLRKV